MKRTFGFLLIISLSVLLCLNVNAQKKGKVKLDPEFESFWKDFQESIKTKNERKLSELCKMPEKKSNVEFSVDYLAQFIDAVFIKETNGKITLNEFSKDLISNKLIISIDITTIEKDNLRLKDEVIRIDPKLSNIKEFYRLYFEVNNGYAGIAILYFVKINGKYKLIYCERGPSNE